jgi:hypothetical protein
MQAFTAVLDPPTCARWQAEVRAALAAQAGQPDGQGQPVWPNGLPLQQHLPGLLGPLLEQVWAHPALSQALSLQLGPQPQLLRPHCWARFQRPPARRLPGQTPHSWHQDGALGFDFLAPRPPGPAAVPLPMLTCWIALTACGPGLAPGLAWFDEPCAALLSPAALGDDAIDAAMGRLLPRARIHHARLQAGDALLFGGGTVHRTHATADMPHDRISLELRWLPAGAWPARLGKP